jgi:tetratricopeptide (TPR) repeat protein
MLSILAYLKANPDHDGAWPRRGWYVCSLSLFIAALLSKAVAVTLPVLLVILDVYPLGRLGGGPGRWLGPAARRVWWEKLPFFILSLVFMVLAVAGRARAHHLASIEQVGMAARIAQSCYGIVFYAFKTVVPTGMTAYYPLPARVDWFDAPFLASILVTLGVSIGLFLVRRRWPGLLAVWLSYLVILAPNLGLVRIGFQIAADRYSYVAMMGGAVLLGAGLCQLLHLRRGGRFATGALIGTTIVLLAALIALTRDQCGIWRTTESLWTHVLNHGGEHSAVVQNNFAATLNQVGRIDLARPHLEAALRLSPGYADAHYNLGLVLYRQGDLPNAQAHFTEALRIDPNSFAAHNNLALILSAQGRRDEAWQHVEEALRLSPENADAHRNRGTLLHARGRIDEARGEFEHVVRLSPGSAQAHGNLGVILKEQGDVEGARAQFVEAVRLDPSFLDARANLGRLLKDQGRLDEARAEFEVVVEQSPKSPEARTHLGVILKDLGRTREAADQFTEALRLKPDYEGARVNLGAILLREGRIAEAVEHFDRVLQLNPGNAEVYNNKAMIWATAPEARFRDGRRAVDAATRANELTGWKNPEFIDTCAAAYAEAGDFDRAVKWQTRAIDLLSNESQKNDFRVRLKLYQANQPYHEPVDRR